MKFMGETLFSFFNYTTRLEEGQENKSIIFNPLVSVLSRLTMFIEIKRRIHCLKFLQVLGQARYLVL